MSSGHEPLLAPHTGPLNCNSEPNTSSTSRSGPKSGRSGPKSGQRGSFLDYNELNLVSEEQSAEWGTSPTSSAAASPNPAANMAHCIAQATAFNAQVSLSVLLLAALNEL